ncbi:MAG: sn-glycerol-3-phosphate ABC transporter ATP-binding protein UgpC [Saprospiraceae bacterium]|nr:sn-glycerol-3-phosphate ABC transporter ATP-binding protein UgpC [Saprospiraceae bacterium]MBK8852063.1 sn-glycerol-3-phosphate ABC transporter ATP-binding protein UgpC [Saprospiraceae bacterium]MBL0082305.1 sn-glycerol-3-phosphate ABC transporter ATP-binding protein UgpC [Saprospiraceae bacterium]
MAFIKFDNVSKSYGNQNVISGLNLEIEKGSFTVLVGPSGCGKSTLLRLIAGLEDMDEGSLFLDGKCVNHIEPKDRDIAIVFQNYALYPHMSTFENMAFGLKIRGIDKAKIKEKVTEVARSLQIEHLLDRKPKDMSGGQRQRVAIGRAIVREPKVFLFDEPLSNLDAKLRNQMRWEIAELHKRLGITTVYVTHDQVEAMTLGDNIVVLDKGVIKQQGSAKQIYDHPTDEFVAGFIGSPPMNFAKAAVVQSGGGALVYNDPIGLQILIPELEVSLTETSVTLGIRPEHLTIKAEKENMGIKGTLIHLEHLGYETFAHIKIQDLVWVVRCTGDLNFIAGQSVWLEFQTGKIHLFYQA